MRGDAAHGLRQERGEYDGAGTQALADYRLADGFLVEFAFLKIRAAEPAPLDEPEPQLVVNGHGIELFQHLLGSKVLFRRLRTFSAIRNLEFAHVVHGLQNPKMPAWAADSDKKTTEQEKNIGVRNTPPDGHNGVGAPIHEARRRGARLILRMRKLRS